MVISTQWTTALGGSSVCYVLITIKYSTSCNLREMGLLGLRFVSQKGWQQVDTLGVGSWSLLSSQQTKKQRLGKVSPQHPLVLPYAHYQDLIVFQGCH